MSDESLLLELENAFWTEYNRYLREEFGERGVMAGGDYPSMAYQRARRSALRVVYGLGKEDA